MSSFKIYVILICTKLSRGVDSCQFCSYASQLPKYCVTFILYSAPGQGLTVASLVSCKYQSISGALTPPHCAQSFLLFY
uniref:Secreted protein n=1 Tax=Pararge aegeria TaxID=116150 RepID=S4P6G6_9NEOP